MGKVNKLPRNCLYCKKAFLVWPHEARDGHDKYCSLSCFHKMPGKTHKSPPSKLVSCICNVCDKKFLTKPSEVRDGGGRFCSRDCYYTSYRISLGRKLNTWTKRNRNGCLEWTHNKSINGYGLVNVRVKGERKQVLVHRVAFELAYGPIPEDTLICHRCDNPCCCNPLHLFMGDMQDNMNDKVAKGRHVKGEDSNYAKLTKEQVLQIRRKHRGGSSMTSLAKEYNTCIPNISSIIHKRSWKHI